MCAREVVGKCDSGGNFLACPYAKSVRHRTNITPDLRCMRGVAGECESNSKYMAGDGYTLGACRRACQLCTVCARGDGGAACRAANRARAGYLPQLGKGQD